MNQSFHEKPSPMSKIGDLKKGFNDKCRLGPEQGAEYLLEYCQGMQEYLEEFNARLRPDFVALRIPNPIDPFHEAFQTAYSTVFQSTEPNAGEAIRLAYKTWFGRPSQTHPAPDILN